MHLLAGEVGRVDDGETAVDLGQSPGDIIFLSSADSELAALRAAAARRPAGAPAIRLANLMRLAHPMSVDLYLEKTIAGAKLVVVRMMGGAGYWPYGLEQLRALARGGGPQLAVMPGEDRWDAGLEPFSTAPGEAVRLLWRALSEGGPANGDRALAGMAHIIGHGPAPTPPEILPHAGLYRPGEGAIPLDRAVTALDPARPVAAIVFYRALLQGGSTAPIDGLVEALAAEGVAALPMFVASLKDRDSEAFLVVVFARVPPAVVLNATAFAVSRIGAAHAGTILDRPGRPVLQVVLAGSSEEAWRESPRGLSAKDLVMNVVLPEVDGRILTRAISFKAETPFDPATESRTTVYRPVADRVAFVAEQAAAWVRLGGKPASERRIAIVLSNYPGREGRIGNGVGLDTPASAARVAAAMAEAGYTVAGFPETGEALMARLLGRQSEAGSAVEAPAGLSAADYLRFFDTLPASVRVAIGERWGAPEDDPLFRDGAFRLALHRFGNIVVGVQPARGYGIDPKATYHDPALVPPHHYLAFYAWLRREFAADAIVHLGKHGNLEWLPGKALGLAQSCWPEVALGATPLVYPFIVNDPGEGAQAKRRSSAVIVDHLMPAMTRAEIHGGLAELETLIDEYYLAAGVDPRRRAHLGREIIATAGRHGLDRDLELRRDDTSGALRALDAHLCELKEMQIRDGLHVLGASPAGRQRTDTLVAIARVPRSGSGPAQAALHRAIAADLGLTGLDPLDCDPGAEWAGPRPAALMAVSSAPWRSEGDTLERIELLAAQLVAAAVRQVDPPPRSGGGGPPQAVEGAAKDTGPGDASSVAAPSTTLRMVPFPRVTGEDPGRMGPRTDAVLKWIAYDLAPSLDRSGEAEIVAVLAALDGRFVAPGPSGAPTRGRPDVLPTGRNFYSVDVRAVPTAAAWTLGRAAADALALRYFQDAGEWPRSIAMSAWSTSNMRTGGDDIAQVLALVGAKPVWEKTTGRVTGFTVLSLAELGRPRIDVTLKISGMFRDAFPDQIDLIDSAIRAIAELDEDETANPIAAAARAARDRLAKAGLDPALARRQAAARIFGARPGAYGAGLQALVDESAWTDRADLAEAFLAWGGFAYGGGSQGENARALLVERLKVADAVVQNQDNREHDILDSDDYYQFQGGLAATVETLTGAAPRLYHGDHARPEKPVVRSLAEEIARVVRGRAANPKWIAGMMRHGYKGAIEMAATVDYLFAFAATTDAIKDHHFDILYEAYLGDQAVRDFLAGNNAPALSEMAARFREAVDRGLWAPKLNSAYDRLSALIAERREAAE